MLGTGKEIVSPSRTYVAVCNNPNFDGHYFRKFTLPTDFPNVRNDSDFASWYFLNELNLSACIDGCVTWEDFQDVKEQVDFWTVKELSHDNPPTQTI